MSAAAQAHLPLTAGGILVVEDDADVRESIAELLRDEGYAVGTAVNGRDALEWLEQHPRPCLILLDLWMPVMSGEEFRRAQLEREPLAEIPVVVISAATDVGERSRSLGARSYLAKPLAIEQLISVVEAHCP